MSTASSASNLSKVSPTESQSSCSSSSPITPMDEPSNYPGIPVYATPESRRGSYAVEHPQLRTSRSGSLLRIYEASKGALGWGGKYNGRVDPSQREGDVQMI